MIFSIFKQGQLAQVLRYTEREEGTFHFNMGLGGGGAYSGVKIEMQMLSGAKWKHTGAQWKYFKSRRLSQKQTRDMYCPLTVRLQSKYRF